MTSDGHTPEEGPILFYDGGCALCHRAVRALLRWEQPHHLPGPTLRFAPLDGPLADGLRRAGRLPLDQDAVVFLDVGAHATEAAALRRALAAVGRPGWARFVGAWPGPCKRWGYRLIAHNRTRWFGRTEAVCPLFPASQRFLH